MRETNGIRPKINAIMPGTMKSLLIIKVIALLSRLIKSRNYRLMINMADKSTKFWLIFIAIYLYYLTNIPNSN